MHSLTPANSPRTLVATDWLTDGRTDTFNVTESALHSNFRLIVQLTFKLNVSNIFARLDISTSCRPVATSNYMAFIIIGFTVEFGVIQYKTLDGPRTLPCTTNAQYSCWVWQVGTVSVVSITEFTLWYVVQSIQVYDTGNVLASAAEQWKTSYSR